MIILFYIFYIIYSKYVQLEYSVLKYIIFTQVCFIQTDKVKQENENIYALQRHNMFLCKIKLKTKTPEK